MCLMLHQQVSFYDIVLWHVLLYLFIYWLYYLIYQYTHFFYIEDLYIYILFFMALINLSAATDFPLLCVEYISIWCFASNHFIHLLEKNSLHWSTHFLFSLWFDSSRIFWNVFSFLSFKGITPHICSRY